MKFIEIVEKFKPFKIEIIIQKQEDAISLLTYAKNTNENIINSDTFSDLENIFATQWDKIMKIKEWKNARLIFASWKLKSKPKKSLKTRWKKFLNRLTKTIVLIKGCRRFKPKRSVCVLCQTSGNFRIKPLWGSRCPYEKKK
jgi:hypothetical protein